MLAEKVNQQKLRAGQSVSVDQSMGQILQDTNDTLST